MLQLSRMSSRQAGIGQGTRGRIWESQKNGAHTSSVPTEVLCLSMAALPGTAWAGSSTEQKSPGQQARCLQDIPCMIVNLKTHFPN